MLSRATFFFVFLFWLTMTYFLWRSEYVGHNHVGSTVPVEVVWKKILTAPDNSSMQITHQGRKVGYCRWGSNIGQDLVGKIMTEDSAAESAPKVELNYQIDFEGNVTLGESPGRLRFDTQIKLSTNNVWQEFNLRLNIRPDIWEVHARAREETVHLITESQKQKSETVFKFADFQDPQALLKDLNAPAALGMLGALGPLSTGEKGKSFSVGLNWKARNDWITIGHTSVRAYRLEATLLDRYRIFIVVSRVGEILLVQLPEEWELINDQLITL